MEKSKLIEMLEKYKANEKYNDNLQVSEKVKQIKDKMLAIPGKTKMPDLSSIENFIKNGAFDRETVLLQRERDILAELNDIDVEITTWATNWGMKMEIRRVKKKKKVHRMIAAIVILVAAAIAVFVCTILQIKGVWDDDSATLFNAIVGSADLIFGIIFFIYELVEDRKEDKEIADAENSDSGDALAKLYENCVINNGVICGCTNNINTK